jgi:hypothetical protein
VRIAIRCALILCVLTTSSLGAQSFARVDLRPVDSRAMAEPLAGCIPVVPVLGGIAGFFLGSYVGYQLGKGIDGPGEDPGLRGLLLGGVLGIVGGVYLGIKACDDDSAGRLQRPAAPNDRARAENAASLVQAGDLSLRLPQSFYRRGLVLSDR